MKRLIRESCILRSISLRRERELCTKRVLAGEKSAGSVKSFAGLAGGLAE